MSPPCTPPKTKSSHYFFFTTLVKTSGDNTQAFKTDGFQNTCAIS